MIMRYGVTIGDISNAAT